MSNAEVFEVQTPNLQVENGKVTVSSLQVAEHFEKLHKNVLRDIENLLIDLPKEFNELNFEPVKYTDEKGEHRPAYNLTRDGFTLLAMGFTGKKAMQFKIAYIEAFNKMETAFYTASIKKNLENTKSEQVEELEDEVRELKNKNVALLRNSNQKPFYSKKMQLCSEKHLKGIKGLLGLWSFLDGNDAEELESNLLSFLNIRSLKEIQFNDLDHVHCMLWKSVFRVNGNSEPVSEKEFKLIDGLSDYTSTILSISKEELIKKVLIISHCNLNETPKKSLTKIIIILVALALKGFNESA